MAKGIYVGSGGVAHKVTKAYVGVDNKARKVKKGYIGVAGVAQLFYDSTTVSFDSNPVPTNWEQYISPSTAVNEYGTWTATAGGEYSKYAYFAFDGNAETDYQSAKLSSTESMTATLKCPSGIHIRPKSITIIYAGTGVHGETNAKSTIEGPL